MNVEELLVRELERASEAARKAEQELDIALHIERRAFAKVEEAQEREAELSEALIVWREANDL